MQEVEELREETSSIRCSCHDPNCPFNTAEDKESVESDAAKDSPDLGFGSMEFLNHNNYYHQSETPAGIGKDMPSVPLRLSSPPSHYRGRQLRFSNNSTSLTNITRGLQMRADGTILENDYPLAHHTRRTRNGFSMSHLNRLDVNFFDDFEADCQVDQDGLTSNQDYSFSREAPERRKIRKDSSPQAHHRALLAMSRHSSADAVKIVRHASVPMEKIALDSWLVKLKNFPFKRVVL